MQWKPVAGEGLHSRLCMLGWSGEKCEICILGKERNDSEIRKDHIGLMHDCDDIHLIPSTSGDDDHSEQASVQVPAERHDIHANTESTKPSQVLDSSFGILRIICQIFLPFFIVISILNFMVCLILYVQDYDFFADIRDLWVPASCVILRQGCSCTCCVLRPQIPCICPFRFTKPDRCSLICPIDDLQPPIDSHCSAPGTFVDSIDSYWGPGKPTCFLKFHRSAIVEYKVGDAILVSNIQDVSCRPCIFS